MQLPLGWRNSFGVLGSEQTNLQYFQTAHGKPMLGGNISRAPAYKMDYFARIPLFRALTDLEMYREVSPETDAAARKQAGDLMALYDVRYFVTTPPIPGRYPYQDTWQRTEDYALDVLPLEKPAVWEQDGYRAYRVIQPAVSFPFRVDLGVSGAEPYVGGGWDYSTAEQPYGATGIWATDTTADLYLPLDGPKDVTLRLALAPLTYEGAPAQKVSIRVNGVPVVKEAGSGARLADRGGPRSGLRHAPRPQPRHVGLRLGRESSSGFPRPGQPRRDRQHGRRQPGQRGRPRFRRGVHQRFRARRRRGEGLQRPPRLQRNGDPPAHRQGARVGRFRHGGQSLRGGCPGRVPDRHSQGTYRRSGDQGRCGRQPDAGRRGGVAQPRLPRQAPADLNGMAHALIGVQGAAPGAAAEEIQPGDAFVRVAGDFRTLAAAVDWVELAAGN